MLRRISIWLIALYQKLLSPLFPARCRFYPTCSVYTKEAIKRFGVFKGMILGFKRIIRCTPFCKGGIDPVPAEFHFLSKNHR